MRELIRRVAADKIASGDRHLEIVEGTDLLARLSHLEGIFCLRARKFLWLSTSVLRKSAKTG